MTSSPLPIDAILPQLLTALEQSCNAVLVAEPGAGKTTRVPLALLGAAWRGDGKVIVLEPRRLAARAAARRMAQTLGEAVGETVGYRVRMDSKVSTKTRIEVVTEGVFTRMILDDPELSGISAVLFDEFHERSMDGDLGLALALDVQEALRDDLRIVPMSATLDAAGVSQLLGDAPVLKSEGRQYPVATQYIGRDPRGRLEDQVARAVRSALIEDSGSVLVFLPGQGEIKRTQSLLEGRVPADTDIAPLYGALDSKAQDFAVRPAKSGRRKVVLTTAIAQTSLTIEGVRIVIDSGLSRVPRYDPQTGLTRLETVKVSRATAEQRKGRAGRVEPGTCYRLWEEAQTKALPAAEKPEILESDLSGLVLDVANWGVTDPTQLKFMTPPPAAAWSEAKDLLQELDALDADGALTTAGRDLAGLPLHPRLGHMLVQAAHEEQAELASLIAVIIGEHGLGGRSTDLRDRLRRLMQDHSPRGREARAQAKRWVKMVRGRTSQPANFEDAGDILSLAYPDRIAQQRGAKGSFRLANGRGAQLEESESLYAEKFLSIAEVTGTAARARILLAAPLSLRELETRFTTHIREQEHVQLTPEGAIKAVRQRVLGKLVLEEKKISSPDPEAVTDALLALIGRKGTARLPWSKDQLRYRGRIQYLRDTIGQSWPDLSDKALDADLSWLRPFLAGKTAISQIDAGTLGDALSTLVPWELSSELDRLAPSHFAVPTGSRIPVDYAGEQGPMLSVRVQELFGLAEHPSICGGKIQLVLQLLSPAQRPIQITKDLPGFWQGSWADVKADMKGQYPRHPWPDNPLDAEATRRVKPRK
ncbi:ATP-dependent RNA helicase HrpB [Pseudovibrio axinellae]|uniref:ATP-dependent RNA helicase HrpB n=1 Tax=Pseudovibrio axinellae TaxID=989403 RepID=A0A166B901_9HYPH|nr:ATP-dependent helicase HrpB [Pseudovibrio axinellae]KZL22030.1 ATP-dependent RNA helicase HrpB [Pseudovibrio axinellae]SEQ57989.1 ATP-dependent helicase HrpB [Pseudovibrio axinellae]